MSGSGTEDSISGESVSFSTLVLHSRPLGADKIGVKRRNVTALNEDFSAFAP